MEIEETYTQRGFKLIQFEDLYGSTCNIQKSSLAEVDAIWFGVEDSEPKIMASQTPEGGTGWVKYDIPENVSLTTRMHLTRDQVKELLPILKRFVRTGEV